MEDTLDKYSQTLTPAAAAVPAAYTPNSTALPNIPAAYQKLFSDQAGFGANAIAAGRTQAQANINDYSSTLSAKQRLSDITDRMKEINDLHDPSKYQQVQKADGGYDFLDPAGNKIPVAQYARVVGKDPDQLLSNSKNPLDIQHNSDFNKIQSLVAAIADNDNAGLQKLGIRLYGDNTKPPEDKVNVAAIDKVMQLKKLNPRDTYQAFFNYYPHVYGSPSGGFNQDKPSSGADTVRPGGAFGPGLAGG